MIIEHHTFRLANGVTEDRFLELDRAVQTGFSMFQEGFLRRTTARGDDGEWLIESMWWFTENAERALASEDATVVALRAAIDPATERVRRYETLD